MPNLPKISVIIPAYHAEKTLKSCVNAVLHQDYAGDFEVIVVDDGSTDATKDIAKGFERVIYVFQVNSGPAAARNIGARLAKGEIICFTDSDCRPRPDWVSKLAASFEKEEVDVAAGSYGLSNPESMLARCIHQEILYRHAYLMGDWVDVFGSYNVAFRREIFNRIQGFCESYRQASAEDNDLSYRLREAGHRIRFVKEAKVDHVHPSSVKRYLFEQFRHGMWRAQLYRRHPRQIKGDGYTFFKDILELPLAVFACAAMILGLLGASWKLALGYAAAFVVFELFFAVRFGLKSPAEAVFYALVMFVRAFARALGFVIGLVKTMDHGR